MESIEQFENEDVNTQIAINGHQMKNVSYSKKIIQNNFKKKNFIRDMIQKVGLHLNFHLHHQLMIL